VAVAVAAVASREVAAVFPAEVMAAGAAILVEATAEGVLLAAVQVRPGFLGTVRAEVISRAPPPRVTSLDPRVGVTFRAPPAAAISPLRISPEAASPIRPVVRDRVVVAFRRAVRSARLPALAPQKAPA